jgi:hypothetical protein
MSSLISYMSRCTFAHLDHSFLISPEINEKIEKTSFTMNHVINMKIVYNSINYINKFFTTKTRQRKKDTP